MTDIDKEAIRNEVLAECAQALRERAGEWMDLFNAPDVDEDTKTMSFYSAMQCDDCASMIESLCPDVKIRRAAHEAKLRPWVKALMEGKPPGPLPRYDEH